MSNSYKFEIPKHQKSIIKVIGVGGGGSNAVNHMYNQGIKDVEFIVCNTDDQALHNSPVPNRLQIGQNLTDGLGAGANPEVGKNAALENREEIRDMLCENTRMLFITAGMGGGTGTGAAPVIARVAQELGILTVGIVTVPFAFEGKKKMLAAEAGINELKENCDTVLVILNDKLREVYGNLAISEAFAKADNVLTTASKGIAEIITVPGYVNVDFEDVKTVMKNSGAAVMGSGETEGENRARRAAEEAISSPLLNNKNIHGAQKILLSIISGEEAELQMDELTEITEYIQEIAGSEADVIFGHGVDASLGNSIRVTLIATGFDMELKQFHVPSTARKVIDLESNREIPKEESTENPRQVTFDFELPPVSKEVPMNEPPKKGYAFQKPLSTVEPEVEQRQEDIFSELKDDFEVIEERKSPSSPVEHLTDEEASIAMEEKKRLLQEQAQMRIQQLQELRQPINPDNFKEKLDVPAYLRKNIRLQDIPHSSEKNVSRYHLNDDNQILGNNKFLHDNVD